MGNPRTPERFSAAARKYAEKHAHQASGPCDGMCSSYATVADAYDAGHTDSYLEPLTPTISEGHSAVANAYAATRWIVDSNGYHEAAQAYDAALASPPVSAPVLLTADDPRWRDGAKVRGVGTDGSVVEGWLSIGSMCTQIRYLGSSGRSVRYFTAVYLLEAPDPDADVVATLNSILDEGYISGDPGRELLTELREHGYDITKAAE